MALLYPVGLWDHSSSRDYCNYTVPHVINLQRARLHLFLLLFFLTLKTKIKKQTCFFALGPVVCIAFASLHLFPYLASLSCRNFHYFWFQTSFQLLPIPAPCCKLQVQTCLGERAVFFSFLFVFCFSKYVLYLLIILTFFVKQATKQFLEEINRWTVQYNVSPLSWNVAVKFLMARKFDVLRAIELFHSYRVRSSGADHTCGSWALYVLSAILYTHSGSECSPHSHTKSGSIFKL